MEWRASEDEAGYRSWHLPAHGWSGSRWSEDMIELYCSPGGEWYGKTTTDQSDRRDLDDGDIANIRVEFNIE